MVKYKNATYLNIKNRQIWGCSADMSVTFHSKMNNLSSCRLNTKLKKALFWSIFFALIRRWWKCAPVTLRDKKVAAVAAPWDKEKYISRICNGAWLTAFPSKKLIILLSQETESHPGDLALAFEWSRTVSFPPPLGRPAVSQRDEPQVWVVSAHVYQ